MNQPQIGSEAVGNAVWQTTIASTIAKFSGVASSLIIFRTLDPTSYGIWRIALALCSLLLGWLTALGAVITVEAIRSLRDPEAKTGLVLWRGFVRVTLIVAGAFFILGVIFSKALAVALEIPDYRLVILVLSLMLLWLIKSHAFTWFTVTYQFKKQIRIQIVESFVYPISLAIFLVVFKENAFGLGLANVITAIIITTISIPTLILGLRTCPRVSLAQETKALLRLVRQHGKWALASDVLKDNFDAARVWIINFFLGPAAVGLYGMAESLYGNVASLVNLGPALFAALPRYAHDKLQFSAALLRAVKIGSVISIALFVVSWAVVPTLLPALFPKFRTAIPLFLILSSVLLITGFTSVLNAAYPALRWQKRLFYFLSIRLSISVILLLIFIPLIGIWAVAIEAAFTGYGFMIVRWMSLKYNLHLELRWRDLLPGKAEVKEISLFLANKLKRR